MSIPKFEKYILLLILNSDDVVMSHAKSKFSPTPFCKRWGVTITVYIYSAPFRLICILIHLAWKSTIKHFKHYDHHAMHAFIRFHHIIMPMRLSPKWSCCLILKGLQSNRSYIWRQWDSPSNSLVAWCRWDPNPKGLRSAFHVLVFRFT
jgi:hypothetical protein